MPPFASLLNGWTVVSMKEDWNVIYPSSVKPQ
jgi:hypothetical protein